MKTRVAINGFGRIGRNAFKIAFARDDLEIIAINDLTDTKTLAYLLKHDSNYGTYDAEVGHDEHGIIVNGRHIKVTAEKDPTMLPWGENHIDVVIESTGRFTDKEGAEAHIKAGAKRVVISGPTKSDGVDTIVLGANEDKLEDSTVVISNASCTTNSLGAVMAILDGEFGVEKSMMTTVHSYTASQVLQDAPAKDLREGRNAAENIVPTTTVADVVTTDQRLLRYTKNSLIKWILAGFFEYLVDFFDAGVALKQDGDVADRYDRSRNPNTDTIELTFELG